MWQVILVINIELSPWLLTRLIYLALRSNVASSFNWGIPTTSNIWPMFPQAQMPLWRCVASEHAGNRSKHISKDCLRLLATSDRPLLWILVPVALADVIERVLLIRQQRSGLVHDKLYPRSESRHWIRCKTHMPNRYNANLISRAKIALLIRKMPNQSCLLSRFSYLTLRLRLGLATMIRVLESETSNDCNDSNRVARDDFVEYWN